MRTVAGLIAVVVCSTVFGAGPVQRTLTFDQRVDAQAAIERVYYAHQIGATNPFEEAVPRAVLENKVRKYLEQTVALQTYWKTAITDETLQRELERMAQGTRIPERLQELYTALGNDAFLVKECLARATLVDRLTHNFYAFDPTMHVTARAQAEAIHRQLATGTLNPTVDHPNRTVIDFVVDETEGGRTAEQPLTQRLTSSEFQKRRAALPPRIGQVPDVKEMPGEFVVDIVLDETVTEAHVASYVLRKTSFDAWWETAHRNLQTESMMVVASERRSYRLPSLAAPIRVAATCVADDTWSNGILDDVPDPRAGHTAVWTGTFMVVWGGYTSVGLLDFGGRYDPATDTWSPISTSGAPLKRSSHTAVWTGSVMVVWGGYGGGFLNTGARYDPIADHWMPTTTAGAPLPRYTHSAVWTGRWMLVWGGSNGAGLNDGGRYDPSTDAWMSMSTVDAPSTRMWSTAVWTGRLMVVWGGYNSYGEAYVNTGARYDPELDTWKATSTAGAPSARVAHAAVWTGTAMIVWGGSGPTGHVNTGARYDPYTNTWGAISNLGAPSAREEHTAVWTGASVVVWGGQGDSGNFNTGGQYDPLADAWTPVSTAGAPSGRQEHTAVWTGTTVLVWGGSDGHGYLNTGGRYDPSADAWTPISTGGAPSPRRRHTAVWTGTTMVVWGGIGPVGADLDTGGRYDPATDAWSTTSTLGAPSPRRDHTAVWTGREMLVWGGGSWPYTATGGKYDPITDTWIAIADYSYDALLLPHAFHTAVWTGREMLVWGGDPYYLYLDTGVRYNPSTNTWRAMSTVGEPSWRKGHTAIWTGREMVVWGGADRFYNSYPNTGGRYDPETDTWAPVSSDGAPAGRYDFTAIWTGTEMIVWGGIADFYYSNSGGRYNPVTDTWTATSLVDAAPVRASHTAVWTGKVMIVWGGAYSFGPDAMVNTGGRYDPAADSWEPTSIEHAPSPRMYHSAVWTGTEMLTWGGFNGAGNLNGGGRYVLGASVDDDGDGFSECQGDCNDADAAIYPGAPQVCDGINDDCSDPTWPTVPPNEANVDRDAFPLCLGDCDDTSAAVYPGAPEACNGIDDNCDGVIDDGGDALCTDGNPCTDDSCLGPSGCAFLNNERTCDDGDACTSGDTCSGGFCNGTRVDGAPCNDGNACTTNDTCRFGACNGGPLVNCGDGNPCTDDSCNPETGACIHTDNANPCSDGDRCTQTDVCHAGSCNGSNPVYCSTGCPAGFSLEGGLCVKAYDIGASLLDNEDAYCDGTGRSRNNGCNGENYGFHWVDGGNSLAAVANVDVELETGMNCGGSASSVTLNGAPIGLFDLVGYCGCSSTHTTIGFPSVDVNLYAMGGLNAISITPSGSCEGLSMTADLGNAFARVTVSYVPHPDACQVGVCVPSTGICEFSDRPDGTACDNDDNPCTADICTGGFCLPGAPANCDDYNPCTADTCDPQLGCVHTPEPAYTPCDNYNACDGYELCNGYGTCESLYPPQCDDHIVCTEDYCDPATGCAYRMYPAGTSCSDGDVCNGVELCDGAGGCAPGAPLGCDDGNPCTADSCNPQSGCVHVDEPLYAPCDNGNACDGLDYCDGFGTCVSPYPIQCPDNNACTEDFCDPVIGCVNVPFPAGTSCADDNPCNGFELCDGNGECAPGTQLDCNDNNSCTDDSCSPVIGCVHTNNTNPCDDASLCTIGETCQSGTCTPAFSGLNAPNPQSNGYYMRLCVGPHSGDQLTDADAVCVRQVATTFAGIATFADLCAVLRPQHPNDDPCDRTSADLMVLALNICRARVCTAQSIDSQCGDNGNVYQSLSESDAILLSPLRNAETCAHAKCLDEEINTGRALELNSLGLRREGSAIRLDWRPPYLDDGTGHPSKYHVWRRVQGSLAPFANIGTTTDPTYLDTLSGSGAFEYEVTAVMN